jgi:putative membrane protein
VSLVVGALRAPLVEVSARLAESGESWEAAAPRFVLAALVGAGLVAVLNRYSATIEY